MNDPCDRFRRQLLRARIGDLAEAERQALEKHLAECPACSDEDEQYRNTLLALRSVSDVAPPRHFFVHRQVAELGPWRLFRSLSTGWQTASAAAAVLALLLLAAALGRFEIRVENGALYAGFGGGLRTASPASAGDSAATGSAAELEQRMQAADREWAAALRGEMARAIGALSEEQRRLLRSAFLDLEKRVDGRIELAARSLREESAGARERLYRLVSLERQHDGSLLNERLDRWLAGQEARFRETDAILETLLWMADMKLGTNPGGQR